jgi:hypothetical protein
MSGQPRRTFALGLAGIGIGLAVGGCGNSPAQSSSPYSGDLRAVALAAALENQAVSAYKAVDAALRGGKLGPAIPALSAFVQAATAHHVQHAATWNTILRNARKPVVTGTPLSGNSQLMNSIQAASSVDELVAAVRGMETQAAQTHTAAVGKLTAVGPAVTAAATIAPVEAMHAAALGYLLGGQSEVVSFIGTGGALSTTSLTA